MYSKKQYLEFLSKEIQAKAKANKDFQSITKRLLEKYKPTQSHISLYDKREQIEEKKVA